jgi:carbonic anhydrase
MFFTPTLPMNRRQLLIGSAIGVAGAALPTAMTRGAKAAGAVDHHLLKSLQACTPKDALTRLQEGNARFVKSWVAAQGKTDPAQRMEILMKVWERDCQVDPVALVEGQRPFAVTLSCADSRVDPNWVFACGSGELFQVRSAGNTAFDDGIASIEYAVSALGTSLVIVMGHSGCGAVTAAMGNKPLTPLLEGLVKPIRASLRSGDQLSQAIQGNARNAAGQITSRSTLLNEAVAAGKLSIRSAYFDIASGQVTLL